MILVISVLFVVPEFQNNPYCALPAIIWFTKNIWSENLRKWPYLPEPPIAGNLMCAQLMVTLSMCKSRECARKCWLPLLSGYLGDKLSAGGGCITAATARFRYVGRKFREHILPAIHQIKWRVANSAQMFEAPSCMQLRPDPYPLTHTTSYGER